MKTIATILLLFISATLWGQGPLKPSYTAGQNIVFSYPNEKPLTLVVLHAYGTSMLSGQLGNKQNTFTIPAAISQKAGSLKLIIYQGAKAIWQGNTQIQPNQTQNASIEAYCGPKHLVVNKNDFAMVTATALDVFDNPLPPNTPIGIHSMVNNKLRQDTVPMQGLVAFKRVYAPAQTGYGAVTAYYAGASSKAFRLDYYANDPAPFELFYAREHAYADGQQLIKLYTSTIKDRQGNTIENGTQVVFVITDAVQRKTIAFAHTINGRAEVELPAPTFATTWQVQASIQTYANSNTQNLAFKPSIKAINAQAQKQQLVVGPIKGYMNQLIKQGMLVNIQLTNAQRTLSYALPAKQGMVYLNYKERLIPPGTYQATIQVGGISKTLTVYVNND